MPAAPDNLCLADHWHRLLQARGGDCAVHDLHSGSRHTFNDIDAATDALRQQLRRALQQHSGLATGNAANKSTSSGATVLLCQRNSAAWLHSYLALALEGACVVPVEPETSAALTAEKCQRLAAQLHASLLIDAEGIHPLATTGRQVPDNPAAQLIKLTSGSTGQPQALAFTEANMLADARNICTTMQLRPDAINYAVIPFSHSYGLGNLVYPFFMQGSAIVCGTSILPRVVAAEIADSGATFFPAVPTLARALIAAQAPAAHFARLERIICAGSALGADLAQKFDAAYGKRLHNFYGSSETGGICFDRDGEATLRGDSVGHPLSGVSIAIDAEGCVRVRSQAVCAALDSDGCGVSLQDRGELLADGRLRLLGRAGAVVKIGARRLSLSEWETRVREIPGIDDVVAATLQRPDNGETVLAAALCTRLQASELRALLRTSLPVWQQPRRLLVLHQFPLNARGKTDATQLRTLLRQHRAEED